MSLMTRVLVVALLLLSAPALAQEADEVRTRFNDFDELSLTGERARPNLLYSDARQRARFERMFNLRRSFLPEVRRTAQGDATIRPPGRR